MNVKNCWLKKNLFLCEGTESIDSAPSSGDSATTPVATSMLRTPRSKESTPEMDKLEATSRITMPKSLVLPKTADTSPLIPAVGDTTSDIGTIPQTMTSPRPTSTQVC